MEDGLGDLFDGDEDSVASDSSAEDAESYQSLDFNEAVEDLLWAVANEEFEKPKKAVCTTSQFWKDSPRIMMSLTMLDNPACG